MFNKVSDVKPLKEYVLLVTFSDNSKKTYNVKQLFDKYQIFKALEYVKGLFEQVKVDTGGYGVSWNDDLDLSCDELYYNGKDLE